MPVPALDLSRFTIVDHGSHTIITENANGRAWRLDALDTKLLRCIDGERSVDEIDAELARHVTEQIPRANLWRALDTLADIGVLASRLAPPAGGQSTSRRGFLARVGVSAVLGGFAAAPAFADEAGDKKAAEQDVKKAAEETAKEGARKGGATSVPGPAALGLLGLGLGVMAVKGLKSKKPDTGPEGEASD